MDDERKKDIVLGDQRRFGDEQVKMALTDMREYFAGKASIDEKASANEQWWRVRHWSVLNDNNEGLKAGVNVGSAWLFNSLVNKHAAIMDSLPKPNVLPREADDEAEAKILTSILPVILEQNDYEQLYRQMGFDICKDGAAITSVLWDSTKHDGMGDIALSNIDVHNIAWKPGIEDIQDSDKVYYVRLMDIDEALTRWPELNGKVGPQDTGMITRYIHDDNVDTSNCVEVIDMYYKKPTVVPVYMDGLDEQGQPTKIKIHDIPKMVLHLAIIVGDQLVFCSENEEGYEDGFYEHGLYPFVIRKLFPIKDTPWGFGYLDIMKNPQRDIDRLDQAIIKNAMMKARPRYWGRKNAAIDMQQFADWNQEIVEVGTGDLSDAVRLIEVNDVPSGAMNHLMNKVDELKETSGNRDFNQGGTTSGVTAAASIAALQEAGNALNRDTNKELYRGSREEYHMVIELIRQFYTEPRSFRVDPKVADALNEYWDESKGYKVTGMGDDYRFILYTNAGIVANDTMTPAGTRHRKAIFDISVSAEKQSPFSRAAQNELIKELYGNGFFDPNNTLPAKTALNAMDFEGKDKLLQEIEQNSIIMQQWQAAMGMVQQLSMMDPRIAQMAMQQGLIDPEAMMQQGPPAGEPQQDTSGGYQGGSNGLSYADKIRQRTLNASSPT